VGYLERMWDKIEDFYFYSAFFIFIFIFVFVKSFQGYIVIIAQIIKKGK